MNMKNLILFSLLMIPSVGFSQDKIVFRDASGRLQGTAYTDRNQKTTYRDQNNRGLGTAQYNPRLNRTQFQGPNGHYVGSATGQFKPNLHFPKGKK